jgi:hypothetical protein
VEGSKPLETHPLVVARAKQLRPASAGHRATISTELAAAGTATVSKVAPTASTPTDMPFALASLLRVVEG